MAGDEGAAVAEPHWGAQPARGLPAMGPPSNGASQQLSHDTYAGSQLRRSVLSALMPPGFSLSLTNPRRHPPGHP